jgi:hypothetical protein
MSARAELAPGCPDLSGAFYCKAEAPNTSGNEWLIAEERAGDFYTFTIEYKTVSGANDQSHTYTSDGVVRQYIETVIWKDPNGASTRDLNYTAALTCADGKAILAGATEIPGYGSLPFTMEYSLTAGGNLALHWWSPGGPPHRDECTRQ